MEADRRTEGQLECATDRPTEQGTGDGARAGDGARESGREGCVDGYTGCMNGRIHGCMDYSDCLLDDSVTISKHNRYLSNPNYLLKADW